jgi:hypothetical protein
MACSTTVGIPETLSGAAQRPAQGFRRPVQREREDPVSGACGPAAMDDRYGLRLGLGAALVCRVHTGAGLGVGLATGGSARATGRAAPAGRARSPFWPCGRGEGAYGHDVAR